VRSFIQSVFSNKAAMIIIIIMVLVMGGISYSLLPREFLPEADNPQVTVSVIGPGYDASSMEKSVTIPLEQALRSVKGQTNALSTSGDGFSQVVLDFGSKTNMKEAKQEVERAVNAVTLPERVSPPYVIQYNTSMIPISFVTVTFEDGVSEAQKEFLEKRAINEFRKIEGVGDDQLSGKSLPKLSIIPDAVKLADRGVPLQALYGVLQGRVASASVGESTLDGQIVNLNVSASLQDVEAVKMLPVAEGVKLGDVAEVTFVDDKESTFRIDGKNALQLVISKSVDANAVTVAKGVEEAIVSLNVEYKDMSLKKIISFSDQVVHSVNSMIREVLYGALLATIVILLFMRNIRATLVTIVSIPLSLAMTLYLLNLSGITLNILTLGAVAVAVGRLVDDSIVVIENIFRRLQKEKFSTGLIIDATQEVSRAITASTLTTVAVFLPISLLGGSLQSFLLPFALTMTYSLLSSLLVALTVIPLLSAGFLKNSVIKEHLPSKRFSSFLEWNLRHKWLPILLAILLLFGSIATYVSIPKGAIDSSSTENLSVTLEYKSDTPIAEVLENANKLEAFLIEQDEAEWVSMVNGNDGYAFMAYGAVSSPTLVTFMIQMKEYADAENIIDAVKAQRNNYPGATLNAGTTNFFSGASSTQVFVDIIGEDQELLTKTAADVIAKIEPIKGVLKVQSNQEEKKTVYTLEVNATEAKAGNIAVQLQGMLNPVPIGSITVDGQAVKVVLEPSLKPKSKSELSTLTVMTDTGPKPISSVAEWVKSEQSTKLYHKDGQSYIRIAASVEPSQLSIVGSEIKKQLAEVTPPKGVDMFVGGAAADQSEDMMSLMLMLLVSIFIVYLIMVITFKTLRAPFAIISSILFVPIGAVLGLIVTGVTPDFTAIFGVVMLVGIVVTNAIVLIDRVKHNEKKMSIRESLIEAAGIRMRPILMTATATIGAMLPLVWGSSETGSIVSQSLAIVVIGGLSIATLLTLVIVPCIYELLHFSKSARQRRELAAQKEMTAQKAA
jgi:multidrug efflux pump subunit AcrB